MRLIPRDHVCACVLDDRQADNSDTISLQELAALLVKMAGDKGKDEVRPMRLCPRLVVI